MAGAETTDDWTTLPYAAWLEESIQAIVAFAPRSIAIQMMNEMGLVETCYYNTSPNDRACMIDAMRDDAMWEWLIANRREIREILEDGGEGEDDDELQDTDTETDSEE